MVISGNFEKLLVGLLRLITQVFSRNRCPLLKWVNVKKAGMCIQKSVKDKQKENWICDHCMSACLCRWNKARSSPMKMGGFQCGGYNIFSSLLMVLTIRAGGQMMFTTRNTLTYWCQFICVIYLVNTNHLIKHDCDESL